MFYSRYFGFIPFIIIFFSLNNSSNYLKYDLPIINTQKFFSDTLLNRYTGIWEITNESKEAEWTIETSDLKFEQIGSYKLNGKLLELRSKNDGLEIYELIQLDPERDRYERWLFDSKGYASNWIGNWNAENNAMIWTLQTCSYLDEEPEVSGEIIENFITEEKYTKSLKIVTEDGIELVNINSIHEKIGSMESEN